MWLQFFIGIIVVFLALIALSFCIYLFGKIMTAERKPKKEKQVAEKATPEKNIVVEVDGDDELIAVITAAVSAYFSDNGITPECKIRVKSFNRVTSQSPIWNEVNKNELVQNI